MFGLRRMTHDGTATVVSCELKQGALSWTSTDSRGRSTTTFVLILDVSPEGAARFRAETHHQFSPLRHPDPGDSLRVRCNPEKQTVEIDISTDERFNPKIFRPANERKLKEEHDRLLNASPGTPAPGGHGEIDDAELAELVRLEHENLKREGG